MYMCMDAITGWSVIYFVLLVFTGGFFLLNLAGNYQEQALDRS